jgi:hypothetical protein
VHPLSPCNHFGEYFHLENVVCIKWMMAEATFQHLAKQSLNIPEYLKDVSTFPIQLYEKETVEGYANGAEHVEKRRQRCL